VGSRSFIIGVREMVIVGEGREGVYIGLSLVHRTIPHIARRFFGTEDTIFIRHVRTVAASGIHFRCGTCYQPQGLRIAIPAVSDVLDDCTSPTLIHLGDHRSGYILTCFTLEIVF
jgi:hypothetical protein